MKQTKLQLSLAVSLALASGPLLALGLGQIEVKSRLSQPLLAEIPIASANPAELASLSVALASPDAFARVGLDRPLFLSANLEFSVGRNERGEDVIRVSTAKPVDDPFVSFLIEADWGSGKLVREFSVLLDPPYLAPSPRAPVRPARVDAAPATVPSSVAPPPPPASVSAPARQTPLAAPVAPTIGSAALSQVSNGQFGPVARGQTLSEIASSLRPAGVGLNQMMVALLRANAGAFINGNINQLKRGAILRIPTADELASLSAADATAIVREQTEAWQGEREPQLQPIDSIAATPSAPARSKPAADGRLSIVPPAGAQARASQSGASAGGEGAELRSALSDARENLAARDGEIKELRSRVTDLEKLRDSNNKLVALKDSELAALQQRLRELEQARSADAERAAAETSTKPAAGNVGADAAPADTADTAAKPAADGDVVVADTDQVAKPAPVTSQAKPDPVPVVPPTAPSKPWYMQTMTLAGLSVIVVGLLSLLLLRRKAKTSPGVGASRKRGSDAGSLAASINALRGQEQDIDSTAAQPSPDEERLRELRANVVSRPDQLEAHLALLRYLHAHDLAESFEDAATDMLPHVLDPNGPQWREVCALGSSLMPDNALFDIAATHADDYPHDDQVLDEQEAASAVIHGDEGGAHSGSQDEDFERALAAFDLEQPQPEAATSSAWDDADVGAGPAAAAGDEQSVAGRPEQLADAAVATGSAISAHDAGDEHIDDDGFDASADGEHDAAETKLDLAQAYIDIGDNEAAHALLDEVLTEGNASQQLRAERLLADLR